MTIKKRRRVDILDLIKKGKVRAPLEIEARYLGRVYKAAIDNDGYILFLGRKYPSPSSAGMAVKEQCARGATKNVSGWDFWRYKDRDSGAMKPLKELKR